MLYVNSFLSACVYLHIEGESEIQLEVATQSSVVVSMWVYALIQYHVI